VGTGDARWSRGGLDNRNGASNSDIFAAEAADVYACGTLSGTLSVADSPYYVIAIFSSLPGYAYHRAGCEVAVHGPYKFEVQGTLLAAGTETDSIVSKLIVGESRRMERLEFIDVASSGSRLVYTISKTRRSDG